MNKDATYRITRGSFVLPDGSQAHTGELIELPADVAQAHASRLEAVDLEAATRPGSGQQASEQDA